MPPETKGREAGLASALLPACVFWFRRRLRGSPVSGVPQWNLHPRFTSRALGHHAPGGKVDLDDGVVDDDLILERHHDLCPAYGATERHRVLDLRSHLESMAKYTLSIEIVKR
jgi:hypothetical protein